MIPVCKTSIDMTIVSHWLTNWPLDHFKYVVTSPLQELPQLNLTDFSAQRIILLFFYSLFLSLISFRYCDPIEIDTSVIKTF